MTMENKDGNPDDYQFVKQVCDDAKYLQEGLNKQQNIFVKNQIDQDNFYWNLKQKYDKLEKDNEAYRNNMRTFQLEYEKVSAQYQEEARLRPEVLNKVKACRELFLAIQEHLKNNAQNQTSIEENNNVLKEIYNEISERVKNMSCEMNRMKDHYQTIYKTTEEKNEILTETLKKEREIFSTFKKNGDNVIQGLKSKLEILESNNIDIVKQNTELQAAMTTKLMELQKNEKQIMELEQNANAFKRKNIVMKLRAKDAEKILQQSQKSIKLLTKSVRNLKETNHNLEKQLQDVMKSKDDSVKFAKLTEEKLHLAEEKCCETEGIIAKLKFENEMKDSEIKALRENIAHLDALKIDITKKDCIIKDISDKYKLKLIENEDLLVKVRETDSKIEELTMTIKSEQATVTAKMNIISELMADSKQNTDTLAKTEEQLKRTREDFAAAQRRFEEKEASLKEHFQNRLQKLENELQGFRQSAQEVRQRDFFLSPVHLQVTAERPEQVRCGTNAYNDRIDQEEINRRFELMRRGETISHLPLSGLLSVASANDSSVGLSMVDFPPIIKQSQNEPPKQRKFFKNKKSPKKY